MKKYKENIENRDVLYEQMKEERVKAAKEEVNKKIKISDLSKLNPLDFYIHSLFSEYGFDYKEVIKLFTSDSGKYIESAKYKLTKNKNDLIITKND